MTTRRKRARTFVVVVLLALGGANLAYVIGAHEADRETWLLEQTVDYPELPRAFETDPKGWALLQDVLSAVPGTIDDQRDLRERLTLSRPEPGLSRPPEQLARWREAEHLLDRLPEALALSGLSVPSTPVTAPSDAVPNLLGATVAARALSLRALEHLAADRHEEAIQDLTDGLHLGLLLEHAGPQIIAVMVGVAVQATILTVLEELLQEGLVLQPAAIELLASRLKGWRDLPPGFPHAYLGECDQQQVFLEDLAETTGKSRAEHIETATGRKLPARVGMRGTWVYSAERTVSAHRAGCEAALLHLMEPPATRSDLPDPNHRFWTGAGPIRFVNNPVGRVLLGMLQFQFLNLASRGDAVSARRAAIETVLGLHRFGQDRGAFPPRLQDLVPRFLDELPNDPHTRMPLLWEAETGRLRASPSSPPRPTAAPLEWTVARPDKVRL